MLSAIWQPFYSSGLNEAGIWDAFYEFQEGVILGMGSANERQVLHCYIISHWLSPYSEWSLPMILCSILHYHVTLDSAIIRPHYTLVAEQPVIGWGVKFGCHFSAKWSIKHHNLNAISISWLITAASRVLPTWSYCIKYATNWNLIIPLSIQIGCDVVTQSVTKWVDNILYSWPGSHRQNTKA